jgi:signal peptidase I
LIEDRLENKVQNALSEMWQEACEAGRTVSFRIASGSMTPFLNVGDIVRVRHVEPSDIRMGDIVAFKNGQNIIVHRIIRIDRSNGCIRFYQMGDAGGVSENIQADSVIGKVTAINKNDHEIRLDSPGQVISNKIFGWRSILIDYYNRKQHTGISAGLRLFFKPAWRLFRTLYIWHS